MRTPAEFWRHWHISLSTWLRDYLYIPLGGNRGTAWRTRRNLLVTMVLGGLWHGAAWTFVVVGGYQGLLLVAYREVRTRWTGAVARGGWADAAIRIASWALTLQLVCYGWLLFRARSLDQIAQMTGELFTGKWQRTPLAHDTLIGLAAFGLPLLALRCLRGVARRPAGGDPPATRPALRDLRRVVLSRPAVRAVPAAPSSSISSSEAVGGRPH